MTQHVLQSGRAFMRLMTLIVVVLWMCVECGCVQAQQERGVVQRVLEFLTRPAEPEQAEPEALQEAVQVRGAFAPNAAADVMRAPGEIASRQKRLDAWCLALEDRLAKQFELTDQQRGELKKLLTKEAALNQQRWKRREPEGRAMPDSTVIVFAGKTGPTRRILRAVDRTFADLLSESQMERYTEVSQHRRERIGDWFAQRAVAVINSELYLSEEQLQACFEDLRQHAGKRSNGLYAFHQQNHYLPYERLDGLLNRLKSVKLTAIQKQRSQDLKTGNSNNNHVMVTINGGAVEQNEEQLNAIYQQSREEMLNAAAVRAEFITTSLQLPQREARHLQVAGKGVTIRTLNAWKKQTREQIASFAENPRFGPGITIGLAGPQLNAFEQDQIWQRAVDRVCAATDADLVRQRQQQERQGATAFVLATLDRELSLQSGQLDELQRLVEEAEPQRVAKNQHYCLELAILARTLVRIDEERLSNLLSAPQMTCWELMKSQFRFQNDTRARISTQHGDLQLRLTDPSYRRSGARGE